MVERPNDRNEERVLKARRDLERVQQQQEKLLGAGSSDPDGDGEQDKAEIWGKRLGRSLGYAVAAYLIYYLFTLISFS